MSNVYAELAKMSANQMTMMAETSLPLMIDDKEGIKRVLEIWKRDLHVLSDNLAIEYTRLTVEEAEFMLHIMQHPLHISSMKKMSAVSEALYNLGQDYMERCIKQM